MTVREMFDQWLDTVPASELCGARPVPPGAGIAFLPDTEFAAALKPQGVDALSHHAPSFTRFEGGYIETACAKFVSPSRIAPASEAPTCPECAAWCGISERIV